MAGCDTTIGLPYVTRDLLQSMKLIPAETYGDVILRIVDRAERVEYLEAEIEQLRHELELCHLECEGLKGANAGKELKKAYGEAKL